MLMVILDSPTIKSLCLSHAKLNISFWHDYTGDRIHQLVKCFFRGTLLTKLHQILFESEKLKQITI